METSLTNFYQVCQTTAPAERFDHSFHWMGRAFISTVRVTIFRHNGYNLVILQDLGKGTSVTNACEQIATEVGMLKNLIPERTVWVECYPKHGRDFDVDHITFQIDISKKMGYEYRSPHWQPLRHQTVVDFLRKNLDIS